MFYPCVIPNNLPKKSPKQSDPQMNRLGILHTTQFLLPVSLCQRERVHQWSVVLRLAECVCVCVCVWVCCLGAGVLGGWLRAPVCCALPVWVSSKSTAQDDVGHVFRVTGCPCLFLGMLSKYVSDYTSELVSEHLQYQNMYVRLCACVFQTWCQSQCQAIFHNTGQKTLINQTDHSYCIIY